MKLNILHLTADYRGDRTADTFIAVDPIPGETVEHLVERLIPTKRPYVGPELDAIQIRRIKEV